MHYLTKQALQKHADEYFNAIQPQSKRDEIEEMYLAFRARLIYELRVQGYACEGAVSGYLE